LPNILSCPLGVGEEAFSILRQEKRRERKDDDDDDDDDARDKERERGDILIFSD
jgi:hypothetical protein